MSMTKDEFWDVMAEEHEKFVTQALENGFPMWMVEDYTILPPPESETDEKNELPF